MAKRYPKETKEEVLNKIREGQQVSKVAKAFITFLPAMFPRATCDPPSLFSRVARFLHQERPNCSYTVEM